MLTSRNCGKYLYKKFHEDRTAAQIDRTQFTSDELTYLEITSIEGTGRYRDETFKIPTQPIDVEKTSSSEAIDIRDFKERGH